MNDAVKELTKERLEGFREGVLAVSGPDAILMTRSEHMQDMTEMLVSGVFLAVLGGVFFLAEKSKNKELVKRAYEHGRRDGRTEAEVKEF